jgi:lantibiotic transport system permease protein
MSPLLRALSAETIKLRGTLALWLCLIAPAVVVGLYVMQLLVSKMGDHPPGDPAQAWTLFAQACLALWCFLMLPLFVTLEAALLAGLEHNDRQWKHLLALPVPRRVHYLAKFAALAGLLLLATLAFFVLIPIGGALVMWLKPAFGIAGPPPWDFMAQKFAAIFAAALLIVAIHTWISIRWRSFTVAVATGMTATVMGFLIGQSERFGYLFPWTMPLQVMANSDKHLTFVVVAGLAGATVVTAIGLWDFLRREFA